MTSKMKNSKDLQDYKPWQNQDFIRRGADAVHNGKELLAYKGYSLAYKGWQGQNAVRRGASAVQKHPVTSLKKASVAAANLLIVDHVKLAAKVLPKAAHALWEPLPWAVTTSRAGVAAATEAFKRLYTPGSVPTISDDALHLLQQGLGSAVQRARGLEKPSISINKNEYIKHVGWELPVKAAKILAAAAIIHLTPLGHTAIGHFLAPAGEEHFLASVGLNSVSELGLAAGCLYVTHKPFMETLRQSGLWELDVEKSEFMEAQGKSRREIQAMSRAFALLNSAASTDALTAKEKKIVGAGLEAAKASKLPKAAPAAELATPAAATTSSSSSYDYKLGDSVEAEVHTQEQFATDFFEDHITRRASPKNQERFVKLLERKAKAHKKEADNFSRQITRLKKDKAALTVPSDVRRIDYRIAKVDQKQRLAAVRLTRTEIEQQMAQAADDDKEMLYAQYLSTKAEAQDAKSKRWHYKALQHRSSAWVQPDQVTYKTKPALFRLVKDGLWYTLAVIPVFNFPYWGVRLASSYIASRRLDKAVAQAETLSR